eukprot:366006-Chlamydomonas_euryale.AAC.13
MADGHGRCGMADGHGRCGMADGHAWGKGGLMQGDTMQGYERENAGWLAGRCRKQAFHLQSLYLVKGRMLYPRSALHAGASSPAPSPASCPPKPNMFCQPTLPPRPPPQ